MARAQTACAAQVGAGELPQNGGVDGDEGGLGPFLPGAIAWVAFFGWLQGRALCTHLHVARALSRLGERDVAIDLLDLRPLAPFVRWRCPTFTPCGFVPTAR